MTRLPEWAWDTILTVAIIAAVVWLLLLGAAGK